MLNQLCLTNTLQRVLRLMGIFLVAIVSRVAYDNENAMPYATGSLPDSLPS